MRNTKGWQSGNFVTLHVNFFDFLNKFYYTLALESFQICKKFYVFHSFLKSLKSPEKKIISHRNPSNDLQLNFHKLYHYHYKCNLMNFWT